MGRLHQAYDQLHRALLRVFHEIEAGYDRLFGERNNPFYFLGAIPILLLFILLFTGLYLFLYYSVAADGAYESVRYVTDRAFGGRFMRSLHRYASDAMMFFVLLHMVRIFAERKYQGHRAFAWWIGIVIFVLILIQGVVGYMLPLDSTARFVMFQTAEVLTAARIFGDTLPRSFASPALMGKWLMWVMLVVHLAIPLGFLFLLFIHVKRVSRARIIPSRGVSIGVTVLLLVFSLVFPIRMLARADQTQLPFLPEMDAFYLFFAPLLQHGGSWQAWAIFLGVVGLLVGTPWLRPKEKVNHAVLDLSMCTGCTLCSKDCPYEAIRMQPRTDGQSYKMEALVDEELCAGCGLCVGACDFEGMHLDRLRLGDMEEQLNRGYAARTSGAATQAATAVAPVVTPAAAASAGGTPPGEWLAVVCQPLLGPVRADESGHMAELPGARLLNDAPCVGVVGPRLIEKARTQGATGLLMGVCAEGDCRYREGDQWMRDRVAGTRKPSLKRIRGDFPVAMLRAKANEREAFFKEARAVIESAGPDLPQRIFKRVFGFGRARAAVAVFVSLAFFGWLFYMGAASRFGAIPLEMNRAVLRLDFFLLTERKGCDLSGMAKGKYEAVLAQRMRNISFKNLDPEAQKRIKASIHASLRDQFCPRSRRPLEVSIFVDEQLVAKRSFRPSGLQDDGLTYVLFRHVVQPGQHKVRVTAVQKPGRTIEFVRSGPFVGGSVYFVDYDKQASRFFLRDRRESRPAPRGADESKRNGAKP